MYKFMSYMNNISKKNQGCVTYLNGIIKNDIIRINNLYLGDGNE